MKSAQRFSNRVDDYVRARPGYPPGVVAILVARFGLAPSWTIADVGAGTGISSALFLDHGCTVIAVEPNAAMRAAAVERFGGNSRFRAVDAHAEGTTLDDDGVDAVVAAQAFHWFDRTRFREECLRILKPDGLGILLWNARRVDASPFATGYEALLREFATDYLTVRHENIAESDIAAYFGGPFERHEFDNLQVLDFGGLKSRLLSSSFAPAAGHRRHEPMLEALERLFRAHQHDGVVTLPYDSRLYVGTFSS